MPYESMVPKVLYVVTAAARLADLVKSVAKSESR